MRTFIFLCLVAGVALLVAPPLSLGERGVLVAIEPGSSVSQVALALKDKGVIRSVVAFEALARVRGVAGELKAGRYKFVKPAFLWQVQESVVDGEYGTKVTKITIPEGKTNEETSRLLGVELGLADQGYIFPDTYYIDEYATRDEIKALMRQNFDSKVGTTSSSTVILASILEEEVRGKEDMEIVAGILLKRLKEGMMLQVDAYPDSYKSTGLPPVPITNPGLVAIEAAEHPVTTKYWYYMTGSDGKNYYARTFDEHKLNIAKYLKK